MGSVSALERRRFNTQPVTTVFYDLDIDYAGSGRKTQRLDVLGPDLSQEPAHGEMANPLPVYVYFHGGGWTNGDKSVVTKYCATQAATGMLVVNVNYRRASRLNHMRHLLEDANEAVRWVRAHATEYGADADNLVLGGDSAGAQIVALLAATTTRPELAQHYRIEPAVSRDNIAGLVLHCGALDFSDVFVPGSIIGDGFVKLLLPKGRGGLTLRRAARWLSPIEWLDENFAPVLVTTSERDIFFRANLRFVRRLRRHGVPVELLSYGWNAKNTEHTWQQDAKHPESQEVYRRLQAFVGAVSSRARLGAASGLSQPHAAPHG